MLARGIAALAVCALVAGCAAKRAEWLPSASDPGQATPEARDGRMLRLKTAAHRGAVYAVVFSPDQTKLYTAGQDKVVRVWDVAEGSQIGVYRIPIGPDAEGRILALDAAPDGRWLAVSSCHGCMGFWPRSDSHLIFMIDVESRRIVASGAGHTGRVFALEFSPDGSHLASGSSDGTLRIWRVAPDAALWEEVMLTGHSSSIVDLAWYASGEGIATSGSDGLVVLWELHPAGGWYAAHVIGHEHPVLSVAVSRDLSVVATGDSAGVARLFDRAEGKELRVLYEGEDLEIMDLEFSPDGMSLAFGLGAGPPGTSGIGLVSLSDAGQSRFQPAGDSVLALDWSPGRADLIAISDGGAGTASLLRAGDLSLKDRFGLGDVPNAISALGARGDQVAWGREPGGRSWEFALDTAHGTIAVAAPDARFDTSFPTTRIERVSFPHASEGLLTVQLLHRSMQTHIRIDDSPLTSYATVGERSIAVGSQEELNLFDPFGKSLLRCYGHEARIKVVAPFRQGRILMSASTDQTLRFWDTDSCRLLLTLYHDGSQRWIVWSPDGLYTGSNDADELAVVHMNQGPRSSPEVRPLRDFPELRRDDLIEQVLGGGGQRAVRPSPGGGES